MKKVIISIIFILLATTTVSAEKSSPIIIKIKTADLKIAGNEILYEPDRSTMRAEYDTYIFNKKEFVKKIGNPEKLKGEVSIKLRVIKTEEKVTQGENNTAAPINGFVFTNFYCEIISKEKP